MKINIKFFSTEFIAICIGSLVITAFSFAFYLDITKKVESGSAEVVGNITYKKKIAQRKYADQVVWEEVEQNSPVYNNDTIRTADLSEAVVRLKDGTEIALVANSMIQLALAKDKIDIEFSQGSILAKREGVDDKELKSLNIKSGRETVSIGKSDIKLSKSKNDDLNLLVRKGKAKLITSIGTKSMEQNQRALVSRNSNDVEVSSLNLKLRDPQPNTYFSSISNSEKIDFSWEPVNRSYDLYFEVSKDYLFDTIILKKKAAYNFIRIELNEGAYFWRIHSVNRMDKKEDYSDSRMLTVIKDDPVQLLYPRNKSKIIYIDSFPLIKFKWTKGKIDTGYILSISKNPEMKNIIQSYDVPVNRLVIDSLDKGTYYWRIEKKYGLKVISKAKMSNINNFFVVKKDKVSPPKLIYPKHNISISKTLLDRQKLIFTWEKNPELVESKLYIAKDNNFNEVFLSAVSRVNFLQFDTDLANGKYYWRVVGILENKKQTESSTIRSFRIVETEPIRLLSPERNANLTPKKNESQTSLTFKWARTDIKGKFKLQISKNKDFSNIFKESTLSTYSKKINGLKTGRYYWRVSLHDNDDFMLTKSRTQTINILERLDTPSVISPSDGIAVNMLDRDSLSLSWKRLNGADTYRIGLYRIIKGKTLPIITKNIKENNYTIDELSRLAEGKFLWTLQAFDTEAGKRRIIRESPIAKSYFTITLGDPMQKLDIKSFEILDLE